MKWLLLIVSLSSFALADGPKYQYEDSRLNDETENIYHDIANPVINYGRASSFTVTTLTASSATISNLSVSNLTLGSGVGKVRQAVTLKSNTSTASTSGTYGDTSLTLSITPTSSSSRILILVSGWLSIDADGENSRASLFRDGGNLAGGANAALCLHQVTGGTEIRATCSMSVLDSPSTTSATTYTVKIRRGGGSGTATWGGGNDTTITLIEIGA